MAPLRFSVERRGLRVTRSSFADGLLTEKFWVM
jgi:hypothetical protein